MCDVLQFPIEEVHKVSCYIDADGNIAYKYKGKYYPFTGSLPRQDLALMVVEKYQQGDPFNDMEEIILFEGKPSETVSEYRFSDSEIGVGVE